VLPTPPASSTAAEKAGGPYFFEPWRQYLSPDLISEITTEAILLKPWCIRTNGIMRLNKVCIVVSPAERMLLTALAPSTAAKGAGGYSIAGLVGVAMSAGV
jgi:hypothetical protein